MASEAPTRRPYHGSCHCSLTTYIAFLTLPPCTTPEAKSSEGTRIRKCNCTTCHKMGLFHVRLPSSPDDFLLLTPTGGPDKWEEGGLKDYRCFDAMAGWYFCSHCGVRCFAFAGDGELKTVDIGALGVKGADGKILQGTKEVWSPKKEGWKEGLGDETGPPMYLSVNASSLDARQEGLDLREWTEKGWINYLDGLDCKEENRMGLPFVGGMY